MGTIGKTNQLPIGDWEGVVNLLGLDDESFDFLVNSYKGRNLIGGFRDFLSVLGLRSRGRAKSAGAYRADRAFTEICNDIGTMNEHWASCHPGRRWAIYGMTIPTINTRSFHGERMDTIAARIGGEHGKDDPFWRKTFDELLQNNKYYVLVQLLHFAEYKSL